MHFRYQPSVFETLTLLMVRGELDCSAMLEAPTALLERYRRALWATTTYVVSKLSYKAAPTEVRVFCSQALATCFFRLPALRHTLLTSILPLGETRFKHVHEWNLPWSLQKSSVHEAEHAHTHLDPVAGAQRANWLSRQYANAQCNVSPAEASLQSAVAYAARLDQRELGGSMSAAQLTHSTNVTPLSSGGLGSPAMGGAVAGGADESWASSPAALRRAATQDIDTPPSSGTSERSPRATRRMTHEGSSTDAAATRRAAMDLANDQPSSTSFKSGVARRHSTTSGPARNGGGGGTCLGAAAIAMSDANGGARGADPVEERSKSLDAPMNSGRVLDQWTQLWGMRLDSSSNAAERNLSGRYWRERLHKRGHCFFLFLEHWVRHVSLAMGMQVRAPPHHAPPLPLPFQTSLLTFDGLLAIRMQPGEELVWREVPGFPSLIKAFFVEMKARPLHMWPESMTSCMSALLKENRQLLQVNRCPLALDWSFLARQCPPHPTALGTRGMPSSPYRPTVSRRR